MESALVQRQNLFGDDSEQVMARPISCNSQIKHMDTIFLSRSLFFDPAIHNSYLPVTLSNWSHISVGLGSVSRSGRAV